MMHNMGSLYDELHRAHLEINKQIDELKDQFAIDKNNGPLHNVETFTIYQAVRPNGIPILEPLIVARAQILAGMAALKAAEVNAKAPRR